MILFALFSPSKAPRYGWDQGATAIEAAFILPVLIAIILGIMEFGTALWQWNSMLLAVEQAGRYVMVNNASCDTSCANTQMQNLLPSASTGCTTPSAGQICVNATTNTTATPNTMTLTATYSFNFFGLTTPFTISSQGTVPLD